MKELEKIAVLKSEDQLYTWFARKRTAEEMERESADCPWELSQFEGDEELTEVGGYFETLEELFQEIGSYLYDCSECGCEDPDMENGQYYWCAEYDPETDSLC